MSLFCIRRISDREIDIVYINYLAESFSYTLNREKMFGKKWFLNWLLPYSSFFLYVFLSFFWTLDTYGNWFPRTQVRETSVYFTHHFLHTRIIEYLIRRKFGVDLIWRRAKMKFLALI